MSLVGLASGDGLWMPDTFSLSSAITTATYVMDAAGELAAIVFRVPKTGTLTRFEAYVGVVTVPPTSGIRFSFQDVNLTTGLPDGTADQSVTTAAGTPAAAGWLNPGDFGATRAVTRGDLLAMVIDYPSFVALDNIAIGNTTPTMAIRGFPYGVSVTATKNSTVIPIFALRYNDGTYVNPGTRDAWSVQSTTSVSIDTATTPDEFGLAFQVPWPCKLGGVTFSGQAVSAASDYDIVVYDSDGTTVMATQSCDGDVVQAAATSEYFTQLLDTEVTLLPNVTYRVVIKPTTLNNVIIFYAVFNALALMDAIQGGQLWYATQRTDAGAWTNFNNVTDGFRRPRISLLFTAFSDGVGAGSLVTLYATIPEQPRSHAVAPSFSPSTIDAAGEKVAAVFRAPKTGSIRNILWLTGTVATGDTVDVRLETVSLTTGDPTGTLQGTTTNGAQVVLSTDDNIVFRTQLTLDASVTAGDLLAIVIVNGVAGGDVQIQYFADDQLFFPYREVYDGGWVKSSSAAVFGLEYSDGSYVPVSGFWPMSAINATTFNSTSTPDERGLIWTPPVRCRVTGAWYWADQGGDVDIVLYAPDGVTALGTVAHDTNVRRGTGASMLTCTFPAGIVLAAGVAYRLVLKPGSTDITLYDFDVPVAAVLDAYQGGQAMHYTSAKNPSGVGSWTQVTTKRAFMGFILDQFDDGAAGGGRPVAQRTIVQNIGTY